MKLMKRLLIACLVAAVLLSSVGCIIQVNTERNRAIVVATINGIPVTKGQYLDVYTYQLSYYLYNYGTDFLTNEQYASSLKSLRNGCLESVVETELLKIVMAGKNFEISDEDINKATEEFDENLKSLADSYEESAIEEGTDTEDRDYLKEAADYFDKQLISLKQTKEEYIRDMAVEHQIERFKKESTSDSVTTEDAIKEYFDTQVSSQKISPNLSADIVLYEPAGVYYKVLKVMFTKSEQKEYNSLLNSNKDQAAIYKKDVLESRAKTFLSRLNSGASIETLIKEVNQSYIADGVDEDTLYDADEKLKLFKGSTTGLEGTFDDEITVLVKGANTGVVESNDFYVIGVNFDRFSTVTYTLEEKHDDIKKILDDELQEAAWLKYVAGLYETNDVVFNYDKIYTNY